MSFIWYFNGCSSSIKETKKATGFKCLGLKYWEINQATPKCQIDFWEYQYKILDIQISVLLSA